MKKYFISIFLIFNFLCIQNICHSQEENSSPIKEQIQTSPTEDQDLSSNALTYNPEYKHAFVKMFLLLIALLFLIFLTFWMFKKFISARLHQANLTKSIKILEKRALSPKSILYLIEIEGKKVVISESTLEVRKIKDLDQT
jgi:flagellar biogenesis protein FliO